MQDVTQEMINDWKDVHQKVFKTDSGIYFRPLKRNEYSVLIEAQQKDVTGKFDWEIEVSKTCLLGGISQNDLITEAGIATVLSENILLKSGFSVVEVEEV